MISDIYHPYDDYLIDTKSTWTLRDIGLVFFKLIMGFKMLLKCFPLQ